MEMAVLHQVIEEPEKISDEQIADVQAIDVGVRGQNHPLVTKVVDGVLNVQACASSVHFVILIDYVALKVPDVERFAFEDEDCLSVDIPATDD